MQQIRSNTAAMSAALLCSAALLLAACGNGGAESDEVAIEAGTQESQTGVAEEPAGSDSQDAEVADEGAAQEEAAEAAEDTEADEDTRIAPASTLGPGTVTTTVGDLLIALELPEELEGGNVAPADLPVSLELLVDGGAIVVFEAVGHTSDVSTGQVASQLGMPDDLADWLANELPGQVEVVGEPTAIDDGVSVTLRNDDAEQTTAVVLWSVDGWESVETLQGHGPPPQQTQQLWLRRLGERWVGVVTYGPEVDPDLTEAIAVSIRLD